MSILLIGANHTSAPVSFRERLAFSDEESEAALEQMVSSGLVQEALILSTCNRVEILVVAEFEPDEAALLSFIGNLRSLSPAELRPNLYCHRDEAAVRHLFRVASSLDSMVIGEPQILGQVRKAYALSVKTGAAGRILNRLLPAAFHAAKRVRTDTNIANSAVSVSYMAVELGRKIFESLPGRTVLVIGAGETAELCARHLRKAGIERVMFTNRTHSKAEALAQTFLGEAVAFAQLEDHLATADIVICSTAAPGYLITSALMNQVMRVRNTPIVLVDISVPRNIDSALGNTGNIFLFNIDDLQALVLSNLEERQREAVRAESMVEEEVGRFGSSLRSMEMGAAIGKFRANMLAIALSELQRSRRLLGELTSDQERAIEGLLRDTVNKISHPLIGELKQLSLLDVQK